MNDFIWGYVIGLATGCFAACVYLWVWTHQQVKTPPMSPGYKRIGKVVPIRTYHRKSA